MIRIENHHQELDEKIQKESEKDERYPDIQKDEDGYKKFNGLVIGSTKIIWKKNF